MIIEYLQWETVEAHSSIRVFLNEMMSMAGNQTHYGLCHSIILVPPAGLRFTYISAHNAEGIYQE